jgi:hypothetical protein
MRFPPLPFPIDTYENFISFSFLSVGMVAIMGLTYYMTATGNRAKLAEHTVANIFMLGPLGPRAVRGSR